MIQTITTRLGFDFSPQIDDRRAKINLFAEATSTSEPFYNLPSYITYLVVKHSEIPVISFYEYEREAIELYNIDLVLAENITESAGAIAAQNELDRHFIEPIGIGRSGKRRVILK